MPNKQATDYQLTIRGRVHDQTVCRPSHTTVLLIMCAYLAMNSHHVVRSSIIMNNNNNNNNDNQIHCYTGILKNDDSIVNEVAHIVEETIKILFIAFL